MDILIALLLGFLMYVLPFIIAGGLIFCVLAIIVFVFGYCLPRRFTRGFIRVGLIISFCVAFVLAVPAYLYFVFNAVENRSRPQEDAMTRLKHEMRRDGRDQAWPAGT